MDTVTYPDDRVTEFIETNLVAAKISFKDNRDLSFRMGAHWTPQVQFIDPADTQVHHEFVGFLPPEDFLAEASFAMGKIVYDRGRFGEASDWWRKTADDFPATETSPRALYYLGASEYKRTKDPHGMFDAWRELVERYPDSSWTTRASVINKK